MLETEIYMCVTEGKCDCVCFDWTDVLCMGIMWLWS